jgi:hypothetical protein
MVNAEVKKRHTQKLTLVQTQTLRTSFELSNMQQPPQHDPTQRVQQPPKFYTEQLILASSGQKFTSPLRADSSHDIQPET